MLLPFQGVTNEAALTQGVASLALGYALVGLSARPLRAGDCTFSPPCLNKKLQLDYEEKTDITNDAYECNEHERSGGGRPH